eukprot:SAG11_NODE_22861_length_398_cov_134.541806_1_plen_107_part_10
MVLVVVVDANREAELKDLEQDKTERAMNKDLGKGSEENILKVVERVPDIVGKTIEVKYDDQGVFKQSKLSPERGEKGTFYKGEVKKYDKKSKKHQVYFPFDKKTVWL